MEKFKNPAEPEMTKREIKQVFHSIDKLLPSKTAKFVNSSWPGVAYMRREKQLPFP